MSLEDVYVVTLGMLLSLHCLKGSDNASILQSISEYQKDFDHRLKELTERNAQLPRTKSTEVMSAFYESEKNRADVQSMAASILKRYLEEENIKDLLDSGEPDLILDTLSQLKQNTRAVLALESSANLPSPILSAIKDMVPSRAILLENKQIFPIQMRATRTGKMVPSGSGVLEEYRFEPLPRRIHGIWKGIPVKECVGGDLAKDDPNPLKHLTPERWATIALKDSQLYYATQGSRYLGFIQYVPIRHGSQVYGSVDFGVKALTQPAIINRPGEGLKTVPLFDLWFERARKLMPPAWKGFIVGQSNAINNAGVLFRPRGSTAASFYLTESPAYVFGRSVGDTEEFKHLDDLPSKIVAVAPKDSKLIEEYGGRMIFDGMAKKAGELRLLAPVSSKFLENKKKVIAGLSAGSDAYRENVAKLLKKSTLEDLDIQLAALKALPHLTNETRQSIMKIIFSFPRSEKQDRIFARIALIDSYLPMNEKQRSEVLEAFLAQNPNHNELLDALDLVQSNSVPSSTIKNMLERLKPSNQSFQERLFLRYLHTGSGHSNLKDEILNYFENATLEQKKSLELLVKHTYENSTPEDLNTKISRTEEFIMATQLDLGAPTRDAMLHYLETINNPYKSAPRTVELLLKADQTQILAQRIERLYVNDKIKPYHEAVLVAGRLDRLDPKFEAQLRSLKEGLQKYSPTSELLQNLKTILCGKHFNP